MASLEIIPAEQDVRKQLERMLASRRFKAAFKQTPFLNLVVERKLKGKKSPEETIGPILYPGFKRNEDTVVRVTASNLRKTLLKYYAREGQNDLVIISLPKPPPDKSVRLGRGAYYTPAFAYNPNHGAPKEFALGEFYRKRGFYSDLTPAVAHFRKTLELAPSHVGAMIGLAEALCGACFAWTDEDTTRESLSVANGFADLALTRAPSFWRAHAAKGYIFMCSKDLVSAETEFSTALRLDRSSTEEHIGYIHFLWETGKGSEALPLVKSYLDTHADNVIAHAMYGHGLRRAGKVSEAEEVLKNALKMDRSCFVAHLALALLYRKQERTSEAMQHFEHMEHLVDQTTYRRIMAWFEMTMAER
jgi:tetratricopeptide (TPR) repeat protein